MTRLLESSGVVRWLRSISTAVLVGAMALGFGPMARAQGDAAVRAEPPRYVTVVGVAPGARVNLRSGPATLFAAIGSVPYGARLQQLSCSYSLGVRWCRVRTEGRNPVTGYIAARFLSESGAPLPPGGDDNLTGGPDFWVVRGLSRGDLLNVRARPSGQAQVLATLREREIVRNLGCQMSGQVRWCRVRSTSGIDVTGWVNGRFLQESGPPPAPGGGGSGASGPDFWVVSGLSSGDRLNIRARPSAQSQILGNLGQRERVINLGCEQIGQTRWCRIETMTGARVTGWVNGRYLREG